MVTTVFIYDLNSIKYYNLKVIHKNLGNVINNLISTAQPKDLWYNFRIINAHKYAMNA